MSLLTANRKHEQILPNVGFDFMISPVSTNINFKFNILFPFFTFLSTIKYTEHFELFECTNVEHFISRLCVYDKGSDDIYSEFFAASYVKRNYESVISINTG